MLLLMILFLFLLLLLGVPIFISLALPSLLNLASGGIPILAFPQRFFAGMDRFALMAVPFFILAANIMGRGGMSKRILMLANVLIGRFYGGTALATTAGCMMFGALSGSSPATVVAIGSMAKPLLDENKYPNRFSLGLIMASASLAILIPPSVTMIIYATVTTVSVGQLFMAGIIPGVVMGIIFMVYSYVLARRHNIKVDDDSTSLSKIILAFKDASWALGVPVIIIGGIYGGVFTPTESATISALYATIVGMFIYRELDLKSFYEVCLETAITTSQVMILIAGASVLSWVLSMESIQSLVAGVMSGFINVRWLVLLFMNILLIIAGMFMDPSAFILILAPLFVPITSQLGVDPIHLGVIMVANGAIGMFSPPFGLNLFVAKGVFNETFAEVARSALVFVFLSIIGLLLITYLPELSLWIPRAAFRR